MLTVRHEDLSALDEAERVELWRRHRFERLGFDELGVELLLLAGVGCHEVSDLVDGGCPPELVLRIVR